MNRTREVLHIMRSDTRALWPFIALHLVLLTQEVMIARGDWAFSGQIYLGAAPLYGSALLLSALLVQRHSPSARTAYWRSLPHNRTSVWAAKWCTLTLMLAFDAVAVLLTLRDFPMPEERASLFFVSKTSSLFAAYTIGALAGALRRNLRKVSLLLLALPLAVIIFQGLSRLITLQTQAYVLLAGCAVSVLISRWLYRRNGISKVASASALLASIPIFAGAMDVSQRYRESDKSGSGKSWGPNELAQVAAFVEPVHRSVEDSATAKTQFLRVRLERVPANLRAQFWSISDRIIEGTPQGAYSAEEIARSLTDLYVPRLPMSPSIELLGSRDTDITVDSIISVERDIETLVRSNAGVALHLRSGMNFSKPVVLARMAPKPGSRATSPERTFRIMQRGDSELMCGDAHLAEFCETSVPPGSVLRLQMHGYGIRLPRELLGFGVQRGGFSFALVNENRQQAIRIRAELRGALSELGTRLNFLPSEIAIWEWFLFPDFSQLADTDSLNLAIDVEWLRDAELVIVEWEDMGSVPVTTTTKSEAGAP